MLLEIILFFPPEIVNKIIQFLDWKTICDLLINVPDDIQRQTTFNYIIDLPSVQQMIYDFNLGYQENMELYYRPSSKQDIIDEIIDCSRNSVIPLMHYYYYGSFDTESEPDGENGIEFTIMEKVFSQMQKKENYTPYSPIYGTQYVYILDDETYTSIHKLPEPWKKNTINYTDIQQRQKEFDTYKKSNTVIDEEEYYDFLENHSYDEQYVVHPVKVSEPPIDFVNGAFIGKSAINYYEELDLSYKNIIITKKEKTEREAFMAIYAPDCY